MDKTEVLTVDDLMMTDCNLQDIMTHNTLYIVSSTIHVTVQLRILLYYCITK